MTSHLRRKHRGVDLKAAQIMPSGIEGSEYGTVAESGQFIDSHVEETLSDPTVRADNLQRSAALFVLSLKECYQISHKVPLSLQFYKCSKCLRTL